MSADLLKTGYSVSPIGMYSIPTFKIGFACLKQRTKYTIKEIGGGILVKTSYKSNLACDSEQ